jgi:hypothetical protein
MMSLQQTMIIMQLYLELRIQALFRWGAKLLTAEGSLFFAVVTSSCKRAFTIRMLLRMVSLSTQVC